MCDFDLGIVFLVCVPVLELHCWCSLEFDIACPFVLSCLFLCDDVVWVPLSCVLCIVWDCCIHRAVC